MLTIFLVCLNMEHCAFVLKHVWVAACVCTCACVHVRLGDGSPAHVALLAPQNRLGVFCPCCEQRH